MEIHSWQDKTVAIVPKLTSVVSATCSLAIIYIVVVNPNKKKKATPYHRLMVGMSICDFLASMAWFFTTWPIPKETGIFGAVGNQQVCSAQGFFTQFSVATVMYNGSLSIYYVLVIVKNWSDANIVKIERYLHAWSITWGLATSTACLALGLFNPVGWDCWIGAKPLGCTESYRRNGEDDLENSCERGDNASLFAWYFFYVPLWAVIVFITGSMIWVYKFIWDLEKRMGRYSFGDNQGDTQRQRMFAKRAMLYVGACYATWLFPTILQLTLAISGNLYYWVLLPTAIMIPIQGFLNLLVYLMPNYIRYREDHVNESIVVAWYREILLELGMKTENEITMSA